MFEVGSRVRNRRTGRDGAVVALIVFPGERTEYCVEYRGSGDAEWLDGEDLWPLKAY